MDKYDFKDQCQNPTQQLSIQIPCRLAERVEVHATKTGGSITNVVIEALDIFLRENQHQD